MKFWNELLKKNCTAGWTGFKKTLQNKEMLYYPAKSLSLSATIIHHHLIYFVILKYCSIFFFVYQLFPCYLNIILSRPRGAWAFDELRRYHTRPSRFNWSPENVHFGNMHFMDLNINARNLKFFVVENLKNFHYGT